MNSVRGVGGKVKAAMIEKPKIPEASQIEPATGHASPASSAGAGIHRPLAVAKVIWLQRSRASLFIGDMDGHVLRRGDGASWRYLHSPSQDLQILVVSDAPPVWDWTVAATYAASQQSATAAGERRLLPPGPSWRSFRGAELPGGQWTPPASGLHGAGNTAFCRSG